MVTSDLGKPTRPVAWLNPTSKQARWIGALLVLSFVAWIVDHQWLYDWVYDISSRDGRSRKHVVILATVHWFMTALQVFPPAIALYLAGRLPMTSPVMKRFLVGGLTSLVGVAVVGPLMMQIKLVIWDAMSWTPTSDGGLQMELPLGSLWEQLWYFWKAYPFVLAGVILFFGVLYVKSAQAHTEIRGPKPTSATMTAPRNGVVTAAKSATERLGALEQLRATGVITEAEFCSQRKRILGEI